MLVMSTEISLWHRASGHLISFPPSRLRLGIEWLWKEAVMRGWKDRWVEVRGRERERWGLPKRPLGGVMRCKQGERSLKTWKKWRGGGWEGKLPPGYEELLHTASFIHGTHSHCCTAHTLPTGKECVCVCVTELRIAEETSRLSQELESGNNFLELSFL